MPLSAITTKGQTTLPKAVRTALGLGPGDHVHYVIGENDVRILKARPLAALYGMLARPGQAPVSLEAMDDAIAAGAAARTKRG